MAKIDRKLRREIYQEARRAADGSNKARYGWTDRLINTSGMADSSKDQHMSWGFCRAFDFELKRFTHIDMPGSIRISNIQGNSQVVRTDTTDRIQISQSTRRRVRNSLMGD